MTLSSTQTKAAPWPTDKSSTPPDGSGEPVPADSCGSCFSTGRDELH
jgi:hypothetical protein